VVGVGALRLTTTTVTPTLQLHILLTTPTIALVAKYAWGPVTRQTFFGTVLMRSMLLFR
jgi:hypothetical protein